MKKNVLKLLGVFLVATLTFVACSDEEPEVTLVESVTLSSNQLQKKVGDKPVKLTAKVLPENATNQKLLWGSSNEKVAKVSENGMLTFLGKGSATITLKATDDSGKTAVCRIVVKEKYPDLAIEKTEVTLEKGKTEKVKITAGSGVYLLQNNDESKLTATEENGVITLTAKAEGEVVLNVKDEKTSQTQDIKVKIKAPKEYANRVLVEGGTFEMGGDEYDTFSLPKHQVTLSDFYISKHEITNAEYAEFLNEKGNKTEGGAKWLRIDQKNCQVEKVDGVFKAKSGKENFPVIYVTWYGAKAFAEWAGGRLPTEAEWEYAAKGGKKSQNYNFAGSNNIDDVAWHWGNSVNPNNDLQVGKGTFEVATKQPNELGLFDMTGNVFEWCNDWFADYTNQAQNNPQGGSSGEYKVQRGGCYFANDANCGNAFRGSSEPNLSSHFVGFRVTFSK